MPSEWRGKLLLIYICNFHVLNHLLLIFICKLHWIRILERRTVVKRFFFNFTPKFIPGKLTPQTIFPKVGLSKSLNAEGITCSSSGRKILDKLYSVAKEALEPWLPFLLKYHSNLLASRSRIPGKWLLIYICNFHVLSDLLLIYMCKLHWNLNTMFVCQVNSFWFTYEISMSEVIYYWFTYVNSTGIVTPSRHIRGTGSFDGRLLQFHWTQFRWRLVHYAEGFGCMLSLTLRYEWIRSNWLVEKNLPNFMFRWRKFRWKSLYDDRKESTRSPWEYYSSEVCRRSCRLRW